MINKTLNEIAEIVYQNAAEKGFHDDDAFSDLFINGALNNLHNETSELHEAWRKGTLDAPCDKAEKMRELGLKVLTCREEELADIILRALDNARSWNIDIEAAVAVKHAYNVTRSHKHGGKKN
jgi:NTP pyrophosphatase (non-canonical NTP hydrolase)